MQKTSNFNLNQWEPTDPIRREDFNADNAALDAALAAAGDCSLVTGSYAGDGTTGRTVQLGFTPRAIILISQRTDGGTVGFSFATADFGCYLNSGGMGTTTTHCVEGGVYLATAANNNKTYPNHYIAFL